MAYGNHQVRVTSPSRENGVQTAIHQLAMTEGWVFRRIMSLYPYLLRGSVDNNDEVAYDDGYDLVDRDFMNRELGAPSPIHRYPTIQDLYRRAAPLVKFNIEPGVAHNDALTRKEIPVFFEQHRIGKRR